MREWPYNLIDAVSTGREYEGLASNLIPSVMYVLYCLSELERNVMRIKYEYDYSFSYTA